MIEIHHADNADVVTIHAAGKISARDYEMAVPELEQAIRNAEGRLNALMRLDDLSGMDLGAMWKDLKFDISHDDDFGRIAIVADLGFFTAVSGLGSAMTGAEVRHFEPEDEAAAMPWLNYGAAD
jgi:hypothetical protein